MFAKTQDVRQPVAIHVIIPRPIGQPFTSQFSFAELSGTSDWKLCACEFNVPEDALVINFAAALTGPGKVWMDHFELMVLPAAQAK